MSQLVIVWPVLLSDGVMMLQEILAVGLDVALEHGLGVLRQDEEGADESKERQVGDARTVAEEVLLVSQVV